MDKSKRKPQAKTKPDVVATVVRATQTRSPASKWTVGSPKRTFPIPTRRKPNNEAKLINKIVRSPDGELECLIDFGDDYHWYFPTHPLHPADGVPDLLAEKSSTEWPFVDNSIYPTEKQLDIVWGAVGNLECDKIRDFLRTKCNVQNPSELELAEIVTICQARLDEQLKLKADLAEKPAETEQNATPAKGEEREDAIVPKPPEFLQNFLWVYKHGKKHWKLILVAIILLSFFWVIKGPIVSYINNRIRPVDNPKMQAPRMPQTPHRSSARPSQTIQEPVKVRKQQLIEGVVNEPNRVGVK